MREEQTARKTKNVKCLCKNLSWTSGPPLSSSGNVTPVMLLSEENQLHFLFVEDQRSPVSSGLGSNSRSGCRSLSPLSPASTARASQGGSSHGGAVTPQHPWNQAAVLCDAAVVMQKEGEAGLKVTEITSFCEHLTLEPNCIIVAVAHMQLTEISRFKSCFCKCRVSLLYP